MKKFLMSVFCISLLACTDGKNSLEGDYAMLNAPENAEITLVLKDGHFAGLAAVNRYFGNYVQKKQEIKFSVAGATMMAGPQELMEVETQYLQNLSTIDSWTFEDEHLILKSKDGLALTFQRQANISQD